MATTFQTCASGALTTTLTTILFTCPANETWRIFLARFATAGAGASLTFSHYRAVGAVTMKLADAVAVPANGAYELAEIALAPGDQLIGGATAACGFYISGVRVV